MWDTSRTGGEAGDQGPALAEGFAGFTTAHKLLEIKLLSGAPWGG